MNLFTRSALTMTAVVSAALPLAGVAGAAQAEGLRVKAGDLSQPAAAEAFTRELNAAAQELCWRYPQGIHYKATVQMCKDEVRDEAMRQLGPEQRAQLAAYGTRQMASAGR